MLVNLWKGVILNPRHVVSITRAANGKSIVIWDTNNKAHTVEAYPMEHQWDVEDRVLKALNIEIFDGGPRSGEAA